MRHRLASSCFFYLKKKILCVALAPIQSPYSSPLAGRAFEFAQQCFQTQSSSINSLSSPARGENGHRRPGNLSARAGRLAGVCVLPASVVALQGCLPKGPEVCVQKAPWCCCSRSNREPERLRAVCRASVFQGNQVSLPSAWPISNHQSAGSAARRKRLRENRLSGHPRRKVAEL